MQGDDYSAGFVRIGRADDGEYRIEEVRSNDIINPAKATPQSTATQDVVRIYFAHEDIKFDFAGRLEDNVVRGNLQFDGRMRQNRVRLVPADEAEVTDSTLDVQRLGQTYGAQEILGAVQSEDAVADLREVAKVWRTSPVLFDAYDAIFQQARRRKLDRGDLEALASEFEGIASVWGERARQAAKLNIAVDLMLGGYEIDFARSKLSEVRKDAPGLVAAWDDILKVGERAAAIAEARGQTESGNVQAGLEALKRLCSDMPLDPLATYALASAERKHGSKDEAFRLFSRLAALPQSEGELGFVTEEEDYVAPRLAVAELYEEKHGGRDGLEAYLTDLYRTEITSFLTEADRNRAPTASDRTTLIELFTGATCPPCVAADVATEAAANSFPNDDVVVLRYHLHVPGPDPLANVDSEARAGYYFDEIATPSILVDGRNIPYNIGGGYSGSQEVYDRLAGTITEAASRPKGAAVELSAALDGQTLRIDATASVENPADSLRLRLAVAESHIDFPARNGVRLHEMVVREMPGGAAGVAAVDGKFAFDQEIPLAELRDRLVSGLNAAEARLSEQFGQDIAFGDRPLALRKLTVVAFLQDDATKEVLQAVAVPIEQEVELPPLAETTGDDREQASTDASDDGPSLRLE